jgi:hypothetical protein
MRRSFTEVTRIRHIRALDGISRLGEDKPFLRFVGCSGVGLFRWHLGFWQMPAPERAGSRFLSFKAFTFCNYPQRESPSSYFHSPRVWISCALAARDVLNATQKQRPDLRHQFAQRGLASGWIHERSNRDVGGRDCVGRCSGREGDCFHILSRLSETAGKSQLFEGRREVGHRLHVAA